MNKHIHTYNQDIFGQYTAVPVCGQVNIQTGILVSDILQGSGEGSRKRGRPRKNWHSTKS